MKPPPQPFDEARRLEALRAYQMLDTLPEQAFDDLTALAARICNTPISLISLVDERRQWFKARVGMATTETPREISFCGHAIVDGNLFVVPDAAADERFADNPLVTGDPGIRFYAGAPLVTANGQALGALCVMDRVPHQITTPQREALQILSRQVMAQFELRRHARSLIESEAQLRLYAEHSPVAVAMFDRELRYLVASRRWIEDYRLGDTAILGRSHYDVFPEVPERWKAIHQRCLAGAVESCDEEAFPRGDGRVDWLRWEIRPWRKANREVGGIIMFSEVITARKESEVALRASEGRYRTLFDYAPDGIVIADDRSVYLDANPSLCRMLGYTRDELVGRHASEFVAPREVEHIGPALELIHAGRDYHREWMLRRQDGTLFPAEVIAAKMPDGRLLAMVRDVSARHELEAQYLQAQKMEAVGRLAGGVAHDFNNLLTAILGHCELLLERLDDADPRRQDVTAIERAGTSAAALTRQLLAFSRKQIIEPVPLDLNAVVRELRTMLARLIGEDVHIALQLCAGAAPLVADRGQIEQVLLNLAVNARDAMPNGGTLTIRTALVDLDDAPARGLGVRSGPYVALTVSDTGIGMTPEVLAHLFEPFFTTKDAGRGTGLGLATVHGIVTRGGGAVAVDSTPGQGSSFQLYLPRGDAGASEPVAAASAVAAPPPGAQTVLVVEDAEGLGELTRRLVERHGYTVLLAVNPDEALRLFDRHPQVDVLLTDVVMPGGSGPELARRLLERRPGLKVVYMSGYTEDAIVQHGVLKPGIAFLNKPFTSTELAQKLREALEH